MMVGVYSECYGVQVIPEGKWFCQKCRLSPHDPIVRPSLSLSAFCLSHRSHKVQRGIRTLTNRCCVRCIFPDLRLVSSFHRSLQTDDERRRVGSRPLREFHPWDIVRRLLQTGTCSGREEVCQGEREDGQSQSSFCSSLLETNLTVFPVASDFRRSPFFRGVQSVTRREELLSSVLRRSAVNRFTLAVREIRVCSSRWLRRGRRFFLTLSEERCRELGVRLIDQ